MRFWVFSAGFVLHYQHSQTHWNILAVSLEYVDWVNIMWCFSMFYAPAEGNGRENVC